MSVVILTLRLLEKCCEEGDLCCCVMSKLTLPLVFFPLCSKMLSVSLSLKHTKRTLCLHRVRSHTPTLLIYFSLSGFAGSLTVSITDMRAPVVGGSGGVYALCSAHLANVVMVTAIIIIIVASIVMSENVFW